MKIFVQPIIVAALLSAVLVVPARQAAASGQAIHLMVASKAASKLEKGGLKTLLGNNTYKRYFLSGAIFPDSMNPGGDLFHHVSFLNSYAKKVVEECVRDNGDACKKMKAHLLGVITHLRTDNRFDRYFVSKAAAECHFKNVGGSAQFWTDEHLDQIAVCDYWNFGKTYGLTFIEDAKYPESAVIAAASGAGTSVSKRALKDAIATQEERLKKEFVLKKDQKVTILGSESTQTPPDWCHKYLSGEKAPGTGAHAPTNCDKMPMKSGYSCKSSYYDQCQWGSEKKTYFEDQSVKGSVNDMAVDIIPGWIQTTYNQLSAAISSKKDGDIPKFSEKGAGMERDLCRNWIAASAAYCKK